MGSLVCVEQWFVVGLATGLAFVDGVLADSVDGVEVKFRICRGTNNYWHMWGVPHASGGAVVHAGGWEHIMSKLRRWVK